MPQASGPGKGLPAQESYPGVPTLRGQRIPLAIIDEQTSVMS
jgi:hypothetical protein